MAEGNEKIPPSKPETNQVVKTTSTVKKKWPVKSKEKLVLIHGLARMNLTSSAIAYSISFKRIPNFVEDIVDKHNNNARRFLEGDALIGIKKAYTRCTLYSVVDTLYRSKSSDIMPNQPKVKGPFAGSRYPWVQNGVIVFQQADHRDVENSLMAINTLATGLHHFSATLGIVSIGSGSNRRVYYPAGVEDLGVPCVQRMGPEIRDHLSQALPFNFAFATILLRSDNPEYRQCAEEFFGDMPIWARDLYPTVLTTQQISKIVLPDDYKTILQYHDGIGQIAKLNIQAEGSPHSLISSSTDGEIVRYWTPENVDDAVLSLGLILGIGSGKKIGCRQECVAVQHGVVSIATVERQFVSFVDQCVVRGK
jgi:hypothetical protein